jgi:hypothetical protein
MDVRVRCRSVPVGAGTAGQSRARAGGRPGRAGRSGRRWQAAPGAAGAHPGCVRRRNGSAVAAAGGGEQPSARPAPWSTFFDLRERDTLWTDENKASGAQRPLTPPRCVWPPTLPWARRASSATASTRFIRQRLAHGVEASRRLTTLRPQARLVALTAAQQLGLPFPVMSERLDRLAALLPDIGVRLASLRPQLVAPLVGDLDRLPGAAGAAPPVGRLASLRPQLVAPLVGDLDRLPGAAGEVPPAARQLRSAADVPPPLCAPRAAHEAPGPPAL